MNKYLKEHHKVMIKFRNDNNLIYRILYLRLLSFPDSKLRKFIETLSTKDQINI